MKNKNMKFSGYFLLAALWACFFSPCLCLAEETVKEPNVAGAFYPENKEELSRLIQSYLDRVKAAPFEGEPVVLISPHAGYIYSGPVAAYGYAALKDRNFDTVIILAPSHYFYFKGASVYKQGSFQTPLGPIEIDEPVASALLKKDSDLLFFAPEYFQQEHSVEVQLPFLQQSLGKGFKIVPIVVGDINIGECELLAQYLSEVVKDKHALVLASTDLSHYRPYDEALKYDHRTIDFIKNFDISGLWQSVSGVSWNICGIRPLAVSLFYAKQQGARDITVLHYANSGDTTGERGKVVGYLSALIVKQEGEPSQEGRKKGDRDMLSKEEKKKLLQIARDTISSYLITGHEKIPVLQVKEPGLNLKRGAFVTLHEKGQLRGCIGLFSSEEPLYQTVAKMAIASCAHDYRFSSVKQSELKDIVIEISVLTEPELIDDWRKIRLGIDGVIVRKGFNSGVFLPQVAVETGWDLETFLGQLCSQKAGLPYEAFKDSAAKIFTFQAEVFSESDF